MSSVVQRPRIKWHKIWPQALLYSAGASLVLLVAFDYVVLNRFEWRAYWALLFLILIGIVGMAVNFWRRKNSSKSNKMAK